MNVAVDNGLNTMIFFKLSRLLAPNIAQRLENISRRAEFLWILSMMRSGSSLLTHLLVNHPRIEGFGECWIRYESRADFPELVARVGLYNRLERLRRHVPNAFQDGQIVLDKLLHDRLLPCVELLNDTQLKLIFLLRQPREMVSSLLRAGRPFPHSGTPEAAAGYCIGRLQALERYAASVHDPRKALVLHYRTLLDRTYDSLRRLEVFLGLDQPLSECYELNIATGIPALGDPTKLIKSGRVVKNHKPPPIDMPVEILRNCERAYRRCQEVLAEKGIAGV